MSAILDGRGMTMTSAGAVPTVAMVPGESSAGVVWREPARFPWLLVAGGLAALFVVVPALGKGGRQPLDRSPIRFAGFRRRKSRKAASQKVN